MNRVFNLRESKIYTKKDEH